MVYVISKDGVPLMPTKRHGKIRHLLKEGKAKVVRNCPFTVKLLYGNACYTQELVLGIDMGSGTIGSAVSDTDGNILYMAKTIVRNDISGKMEQRAKYRRYRRNRKTRYRKPRFDNRANSKRKDRFSPTVTSKIQAHMREIRFVSSMLPVTKIVLETGNFDPHLMKRPDMDRHWGYQKGPNYGFASTKAMVLDRDSYTCQACSGRHKDPRLEVHHIIFRSKGGSDDADNLVTLCHTCHKALHAGRLQLNLNGKRKDKLKHATQMNTIRVQLLKLNPGAIETYGYVTKENREKAALPKDHHLDACVIAAGIREPVLKTDIVYVKRCVPDGDFQKTKGVRSEQPVTTGKIMGFRKFDKVMYMGKEYLIKGRMSTGYAVLMDIYGSKAVFAGAPKGYKTPKLSRCRRLEARNSWITMTEAAIPGTS